MFDTTEMKKGLKFEMEGKPYVILKADHRNPGKGSAFVVCRIKNLETTQVIERTFKVGTQTGCTQPNLEEKMVEYLYADMEGFNFMDQANYETINLSLEHVGEAKDYLQEGMKIAILYYNGRPIATELPNFVSLRVKETDPGLKGDTATGGMKKAVLETGLQINVPLFIKEGELLKIDTRNAEYVERVKE
jgi:elongation factor P